MVKKQTKTPTPSATTRRVAPHKLGFSCRSMINFAVTAEHILKKRKKDAVFEADVEVAGDGIVC